MCYMFLKLDLRASNTSGVVAETIRHTVLQHYKNTCKNNISLMEYAIVIIAGYTRALMMVPHTDKSCN